MLKQAVKETVTLKRYNHISHANIHTPNRLKTEVEFLAGVVMN